MRLRSPLFVLSVAVVLSAAFHALSQVPTPAPAAAPGSPDFTAINSEYKQQEEAVDAEIKPKLTALQDKYKAALTALSDKLNQSKHPQESDKVKAELKRFQEHGLDGEPVKTTLPEIRAMWPTLVRDTATVYQAVAIKRSTARSKFAQALTTLELGYRKAGDNAGLESVKRARSALIIRNAIDNNRLAATELVGKPGGEVWQDVAKEGGYLVGFKAGSGGWFQFKVLGAITPIFATAEGTRDGEKRGTHDTLDTVMAKDGYAVGGIMGRGGEVVNCIQIIFMRINLDGVSLNPQDFYITDWLGGEGGGKPKEVNARGHMIVGVTGKTANEVESLGLISLR